MLLLEALLFLSRLFEFQRHYHHWTILLAFSGLTPTGSMVEASGAVAIFFNVREVPDG
jgi:hypothetical protein